MADEQDGFEGTGFGLADAVGMYDAGIRFVDRVTPTLMVSLTPEREVVFYGPDGFETWRVSFDVLSDVLRAVVEEYGP